jgi:ABC-2 type transport system permease protein
MVESARLHLNAAAAVLQRDFFVFISYRWRTVSVVANAIFGVALFYFVSRLVSVDTFPTPGDYFAFVIVGLVIAQVLQSTIGVALQLRSELVAGTFERILLSPFGVVGGVVSMMIFPFLNSVVVAVVMLGFGIAVFGMPIQADTAWLAIPVGFLGALAFAGTGILFAAATLLFKQATGVQWVVAGITLIGGLYFPVKLLPWWIEWASEVQPFTPTVELLRHLLSGYPLTGPAAESLAKLVGFSLIFLPLSMAALAAAARTARRRGTIIEY